MTASKKADSPNYYNELGLTSEATPEEIRRAYHRMARTLHPDVNSEAGATERFLRIQAAYEVLSDAEKRLAYDQSQNSATRETALVSTGLLFSRSSLQLLEEPQLMYTLVDLGAPENAKTLESPPLNVCLVLDRSTSMQGERLDTVKRTAIELLRQLRPEDNFSIVTFSDRAEVLLPSGHRPDLHEAQAQIQMMESGGGTEIFHGLEAGYLQVRAKFNRGSTNHIILLTDGRTYGDEAACLRVAEQAASAGIGISGLGIGEEWNDAFLDSMAARTGGSSMYLAQPVDIGRFLKQLFAGLGQVYAEQASMEIKLHPGVELRYAFRLSPDANPLRTTITTLMLGNLLKEQGLSVLLEFQVDPVTAITDRFSLADVQISMEIPTRPSPSFITSLHLTRPVSPEQDPQPPPARLLEAISRLTLYRMHERAQHSLDEGHVRIASRQLQNLATHLFSRGEKDLARAVLHEVENVRLHQRISEEGKKRIKYGTRALLLPANIPAYSKTS